MTILLECSLLRHSLLPNPFAYVTIGCLLFVGLMTYAISDSFGILESSQGTCDMDVTRDRATNKCPIIMAWTTFIGNPMMEVLLTGAGGTNGLQISPFNQSNCPYQCIYTDSKTRENVDSASVMIFHLWNSNFDFNTSDLPPLNPNRLNVFFQTESVLRSSDTYQRIQQDFFNLTMTYSPNSDIFFPYDTFELIGENYVPNEIWSQEEVSKIVERKSKLILLAVSHCNAPSGRDLFANKLSEYVNITQYGGCNGNGCSNECMEQEIDNHMFYLAFENSICNFYHTEKFWRLKKLIVPIVLTRRTLKGMNIPNGAYIAADDFSSPRELADYVLKLKNDAALYKKYFEWTKLYKKTSGTNPLCYLCKLATRHYRQRKYDIAKWWEQDGDCDKGLQVNESVFTAGPQVNESVFTAGPQVNESVFTVGLQVNESVFSAGLQVNESVFTAGPQVNGSVFTAGPQVNESVFTAGPQVNESVFTVGPQVNESVVLQDRK